MCSGWVPKKKPEGGIYGYATDDIFYLETCLYSQVRGRFGQGNLYPDPYPLCLPLPLPPTPTPTPTPTPNPNPVVSPLGFTLLLVASLCSG